MRAKIWTSRLVYALAGIGVSAWALLVPDAKIRFHLSDGALGSVLFLASIGGVAVAFLAGLVVARWGSRTCIIITLLLMCILLPALAVAPSAGIFTILLFVDSAVFGILDVSSNAQGAVIEARSGRLQMSGFHASFSLGTLAVALMASFLLKIGVTLETLCLLCAATMLMGLTQSFRLLPKYYDSPPGGQHFVRPNRQAVILGLCCLVAFMCDGAITDWSTVYLHFSHHMPVSAAILGYAAFTTTTVLTRITGDSMAMRFGQAAMMRLGVVIAMLGFGLVVFAPWGVAGIIGFGLIGLGEGNITPLVFSAAARVPGMAAHHSMPTVVGTGYIGFLVGPVMVGLVSSHFGLATAFAVDAVLLGLTFFAARFVA